MHGQHFWQLIMHVGLILSTLVPVKGQQYINILGPASPGCCEEGSLCLKVMNKSFLWLSI